MTTCKKCGCNETIVKKTDSDGVHAGGRLLCKNCGSWCAWNPIETVEGVRKKSSKFKLERVLKEKGFEKPLCFFCNRSKEELGKHKTLTLDHILPIREGGKDEINNINVLCTACHKLRHWAELYMHLHNTGKKHDEGL